MFKKQIIRVLVVFVAGSLIWVAVDARQTSTEPVAKIRVGTYDNRAVAVAYGRSEMFSISDIIEEHKQAQAKGDQQRVKELEDKVQAMQKRAHFQAFGHTPIAEIIEQIKDHLPQVAQKANVSVIAWEVDYTANDVLIVDVTDLLVELFNPDEKTLEIIESLKKKPPIADEVLEKMDHTH